MAFSTIGQFGIGGGWDAVILMLVNILNLTVSTYNAKRINKVRDEQKSVAAELANGGSPLFRKNGKEVK
jgi:hypothetical protein